MDLFVVTIQVVPMLFIAIFLDRRDATPEEQGGGMRYFHLVVALLGLVAFTISVYVVGGSGSPTTWMRIVVTSALGFAMAALSSQVLYRVLQNGPRRIEHRQDAPPGDPAY
ncbi:hypothetical protein [Corynebacterium auris]|uniref:hypothetical protein n=1 Tax=Corynebacterium auris TaxID=44750 RepID=UPI0025B54CF9|nr:hypothetical protein [Corynebacterium auris]WJY66988.1 hypothetical protein CAURIS_00200 [Corynebacterium auris]